MARRKAAVKRKILPDPVFKNKDVSKIINILMKRGKKALAERIFYSALIKTSGFSGSITEFKQQEELKESVLGKLKKALGNVTPKVEVRSRRVGGSTYQVPTEVSARRGLTLAIRWIIQSSKSRHEKTMAARLSAEIDEASEGRGKSVKLREDTHRMAKANQAFAHYRWDN